MKHKCNCPYIICKFRGNCTACIAHNIEDGTLPNCMEETAQKLGAKLDVRLPKTEVLEDYEELSGRCAQLVKDCLMEKPDALLCFPAENSIVRTCELLREMQDKGEVDFSRARFTMLNEWLDLEEDSESCAAFLRKHLYDALGIEAERILLFDAHREDLQEECRRIREVISSWGGIDLMILDLGLNGSIGLNEPGGDFMDYAKVAELSDTPKEAGTQTRGITLGVHDMFETKQVILLASGEEKKAIAEKMYRAQPTDKIPGTVLKLLSGGMVILDKAAAADIQDLL